MAEWELERWLMPFLCQEQSKPLLDEMDACLLRERESPLALFGVLKPINYMVRR